ncbi:MAG: hypothetical protein OXI43_12635 [Candidatus Poribacteria bacterium]|nr:hypothetical protein [Candidatus Poribacteria bacterium]
MHPVTIDNLKRLAVQRGAVGFDYSVNRSGDIDWYRFRFAFEDIEPIVMVTSKLETGISESVFDIIPSPEESAATEPIPVFLEPILSESIPEPVPFANIPQSMRAIPRWCVWQKHSDGRKIPYQVLPNSVWSGQYRCESDNPSMWVSFDEALECYMKSNGHLGGLSFALGDGWWGVDFDKVIVDGKMHPQVKSWLVLLGGYQELSQSERGKHVVNNGGVLSNAFLGTAETGRQFKGIPAVGMATEVYDRRRFFYLTGKGGGDPIKNQAGLSALCDELLALKAAMQPKPKPKREWPNSPASRSVTLSDDAVIEKIRSSRQASKFEALWAGQIGAYPSASEADMALTSILMFWCQNDTTQVERLFERSGLAKREKWDREDYRERTLAKAESDWVYTPRLPNNYSHAAARVRGRIGPDGK